MVAKDERPGGGKGWELGISSCNLVYIGRINKNILLYSTGNCIEYPVINHDGREHVHMGK